MNADLIIETQQMSFAFRKTAPTLQNINLAVPKGSVYGFLGPNGAGKTTTIRLLLGLLKMQQGQLKLFGQSFTNNRIEILKKLGSIIEQPSLYGHLTAKENLDIYRRIYQVPKSKITDVLKKVGLSDTGSKKARQFSLGMKQRLAIAISLLHDPELLILDEPTNGLDPNGIVETRELIKKLNREEGKTILVSSHILNEVERMATHVGIIHKGSLLFQGTLPELQQMKSKQAKLLIDTNNNAQALSIELLKNAQMSEEGKITLEYVDKEHAASINHALVQAGLRVYSLQPSQNDLEQLFMDITSSHS